MIYLLIQKELQRAAVAVLGDMDLSSLLVRPCPDARFGDYQSNGLMGIAKARKMNPRDLALQVKERMDLRDYCEAVTVAGAGFLNFQLSNRAIAIQLQEAIQGKHLFFKQAVPSRTIVLDFSSPNVAKPMHVGHIRSTILGDCLARTFRLLGHLVITDNHIGDWGTQFGKLLVGWKSQLDRDALAKDPIAEMERLYKRINAASEADPAVLESARQELVKLQNGDAENLALWQEMIQYSQSQFDEVYRRLGVVFDHTLGESFYNPHLRPLVEQLKQAGLARESEGAMAVFFEDDPQLKDHPALIQKSDGAANYTTTDLATLAYRMQTWQPDEIIYVTDGRQQLHFKQIFAVFRRWQPHAKVTLRHVWFGTILGEDGKPFKTRSGEVIKLVDLLDEAEERAFQTVSEKNPEQPLELRKEIARIVGLGAVKYADLLPNRQSDYVFSWEKMLALNGNTAVYLLYAYTRIRSIRRKLEEASASQYQEALASQTQFVLSAPEELILSKHLLNFGFVLEAVLEECRPNYLCNYLYDLAGHFARFYENCPVLKAEGPERITRLALCELTGQVLKTGLNTLGLETTEKM